jgi:Zn-dependent peptidase ImmA (M78 family)
VTDANGTATRWSPWGELRSRPDIWVHRCRLEEGSGWWCPQDRVILLDDRLDRRRARCVLAHELAHAVLGHVGCPAAFADRRWLAGRLEAQADRWSARRLVSLPALGEVLAERPADVEAAAAALDVTLPVLRCRLDGLDEGERSALRARLRRVEQSA